MLEMEEDENVGKGRRNFTKNSRHTFSKLKFDLQINSLP